MTIHKGQQIVVSLADLEELIAGHQFHHATYRDIGKCWEGLAVYARDPSGFGGYRHIGVFYADSPDLKAAEAMVSRFGTSVGSYGNG